MSTEPNTTQAKSDPSVNNDDSSRLPRGAAILITERAPEFPCWLLLRSTGWNFFYGSNWAEMAAREDATHWSPTRPEPALAPSAVVPQAPQAGGAEVREAIRANWDEVAEQLARETEERITTTTFCAVKSDGVYFDHAGIRVAIKTAISDALAHCSAFLASEDGKDRERLDWMQHERASVEVNNEEPLRCHVESSNDYELSGTTANYDIRRAIDAARHSSHATPTERGQG